MKYGDLPLSLGIYEAKVGEMFFYQYLPIKLAGDIKPIYEDRLKPFDLMISTICCHFIGEYGLNKYRDNYIYVSAKNLFQRPNCEFNRHGWHSDGFLTDDVNYIWSNSTPTVLCEYPFELTLDHEKSLAEMEKQAELGNQSQAKENELLMLTQFNIHRVAIAEKAEVRAFLKVSFSSDQYNLIGNSINPLLNYNWEMKPRQIERNHPIAN